MSFFDNLIDLGSSALGFFKGGSIGSQLARTAITGYALSKLYKAINPAENQTDKGSREQINADVTNSIPVIYGNAWTGGIITDAVMSTNTTMYICLTLCEKTGNLNLGTGSASEISIGEIWWNNKRLAFRSDGITVDATYDLNGNACTGPAGNIQIWLYNNGSESPTPPAPFTSVTSDDAYNIFPNWTANHDMTNLVFAIVKLDYDPEKEVTGVGEFRFEITNTMTLPGDCLFDYMTNERYGAGIPSANIYLS
jgi:hypothetical protein